ncbi:MAG: IS30 family transposase [Nocardioidaceae bacterium]|nr:IS30 family transposase [Nocardioidaceae bacterium]MBA3622447.1 IS30 family transposase [Euzebyales bacterium]
MTKSREEVERFYELMCQGGSIQASAKSVGVSRTRATFFWHRSAPMGLEVVMGPAGGLAGSPPPVGGAAEISGDGSVRRRRLLTSEERAVIAAGVRQGLSYQQIGDLIGRGKSVVCREVQRNVGPDKCYWAPLANRVAHERRRRPKAFKLVEQSGLCRQIEEWMDQGWSPKLIASVLAMDYPPGSIGRVSHETIYQALYVQTRGALRADLHKQLSLKRSRRKPRGGAPRGGASLYGEAFKIGQRPAEVEDRAVPGHWEGDLILGTGNGSAVGTLVERTTRFTILLHLSGRHDAESVAEAMVREMRHLPEHLRRSITWDRGTELAAYERIQLELDAPIYFCDPHSPWQRGTNENTNRLLRFWLEKGSDLAVHTAEDLRRIADTLNRRPRPTLDLQTPAQRLNELLARAA